MWLYKNAGMRGIMSGIKVNASLYDRLVTGILGILISLSRIINSFLTILIYMPPVLLAALDGIAFSILLITVVDI